MSETEMAADARRCVEVLRKGGIILYPTDTVWGIGCDAANAEAVARIYTLKHRADSKAMIVLASSLAMLERSVEEVPEVGYELLEAAVDPLTVVYDHGRGLAPNLLAADGSVGIRLTSDPFCQALCHGLGRPIVSTSANVSGAPAARFFNEIAPEILEGVDYAAMWRRDDRTSRRPSSVIRLHSDGRVAILRR